MKYLLDTSYFSNMMDYYPPSNYQFEFIWNKLNGKIENGVILVIDKVFDELKRIEDRFVNNFLQKNTNSKIKTHKEDNIIIYSEYSKNQNKFKGSFDTIFKEDAADVFLIAYARKNNEKISILTDAIMPQKADKQG